MAPIYPQLVTMIGTRLGSSQRQQKFSGHYQEVADHLNSIIHYAQTGVQIASRALSKAKSDAGQSPTPDQKSKILSAEKLLKSRHRIQKRFMDYSYNKAAPGMLDLFYLNQTRQHLGEIVKVLQNTEIADDNKLPALEELSSRLDVCREGTALNIMECASQLHLKSQPNKFHAAYQQARKELINTHAVGQLLAENILARAEQLLNPDQRADQTRPTEEKQGVAGYTQVKTTIDEDTQVALNTTLQQEFGEQIGSIFEYDDALSAIVLRSAHDLADEWSSSGTTLPQEARRGVVTENEVERTIDAFFQTDKLVHNSSPAFSSANYFVVAMNSLTHQHNSVYGNSREDDEKRRHLEKRVQVMKDSINRAAAPTAVAPTTSPNSLNPPSAYRTI